MSTTAPGGTVPIGDGHVARVGLGAMQLVPHGDTAPRDRPAAIAVLRQALELGVDHIDTAQFYGAGAVNALVREALHPYPDGLTLATKVGADDRGDGLVPAQRPEELRAGVEANLRTLGIERLHVVNLRRLDRKPGLVATGGQLVDLDSQLAELVALRDAGKIGAIGLSSVSLGQLEEALPVGVSCVQNGYSLLDRNSEPLLERCLEEGIAWVPFFPLGSAFPGQAKVAEHPRVLEAAEATGATPAQVGLAWLLGHAPNVALIPGTANPVHLAENVAAGDLRLDAGTTTALDSASG